MKLFRPPFHLVECKLLLLEVVRYIIMFEDIDHKEKK